jgi:hypothetical protein
MGLVCCAVTDHAVQEFDTERRDSVPDGASTIRPIIPISSHNARPEWSCLMTFRRFAGRS